MQALFRENWKKECIVTVYHLQDQVFQAILVVELVPIIYFSLEGKERRSDRFLGRLINRIRDNGRATYWIQTKFFLWNAFSLLLQFSKLALNGFSKMTSSPSNKIGRCSCILSEIVSKKKILLQEIEEANPYRSYSKGVLFLLCPIPISHDSRHILFRRASFPIFDVLKVKVGSIGFMKITPYHHISSYSFS